MNKNFKNRAGILSLCAAALMLICAGCGTSSNLAGLGVSVNVAQKGLVAGVTFTGGSNSVTVGGTYSQGTNSYGGTVVIPTGTNAP